MKNVLIKRQDCPFHGYTGKIIAKDGEYFYIRPKGNKVILELYRCEFVDLDMSRLKN
jgi:hypothetical protein